MKYQRQIKEKFHCKNNHDGLYSCMATHSKILTDCPSLISYPLNMHGFIYYCGELILEVVMNFISISSEIFPPPPPPPVCTHVRTAGTQMFEPSHHAPIAMNNK